MGTLKPFEEGKEKVGKEKADGKNEGGWAG